MEYQANHIKNPMQVNQNKYGQAQVKALAAKT
jgi:hypothetical protein